MKLLLLTASLLLGSIVPASAQRGWRPYLGVHASGDAEMYYLGPSVQFGSDFYFNDRYGLSGYLHAYHRKIDRPGEKGEFTCLTGAVLVELHAGKQAGRGMFFAAGAAIQQVENKFTGWTQWHNQRTSVLPAIRIGHAFPLRKQHRITIEINATGPYQEREYPHTYTELITQLSLGTRLIW